jgi:hypothetical protein
MDALKNIFPAASEPAGEVVVVGVNEKHLKEHKMNIVQISSCPVRIRIETRPPVPAATAGGRDFQLTASARNTPRS